MNSINNAGDVVGIYSTAGNPGINAFVYSGGTYQTINDFNGTLADYATGINNKGQIVGYYESLTGGIPQGFLYANGIYTTIDDPLATGSIGTRPTGINDLGEIVGIYGTQAGVEGFVDNNGVLTTIDDPLSLEASTTVTGINDLGQIVGNYNYSGGAAGFLATPNTETPIPAALPLFATGLGAFGLLGRRRKRKDMPVSNPCHAPSIQPAILRSVRKQNRLSRRNAMLQRAEGRGQCGRNEGALRTPVTAILRRRNGSAESVCNAGALRVANCRVRHIIG